MRRGRATLPHPEPRHLADGRWLVSRQVAAHLAQRHIDFLRRKLPPDATVACDVATRVLLLDLDQVEQALGGVPFSPRTHRQPLEPD